MPGHPIIVVGASAGGLAPLREILGGLPPDLAASLFVVVHLPKQTTGNLIKGLQGNCRLPVEWAQDQEAIRQGRVYVAPPNRHLLVKRDSVRALFGARENRVRPSADALFRSAAAAYASGVVGVVLSGYQGDGAAGLAMIKRCNGVAVVLDPATAEVPSMPLAAIAQTKNVDFVLAAADIAAVLTDLAGAEARPESACPKEVLAEAAMAEKVMAESEEGSSVGSVTAIACPDCGGVLRELPDSPESRFRCRVGHTFTSARLLEAMDDEIERAMWIATRTLRERGELLRKLATSAESGGRHIGKDFREKADEVDHQSRLLQDLLAELISAREHDIELKAATLSMRARELGQGKTHA